MKRFVLFILGLVLVLISNTVYSQTVVFDEEVKGNWTKANSPYIVLRNIIIPNDTSLTIEPGVEVQFAKGYGMEVYGNLLAIGNDDEKIVLTSADATSVKNNSTLGWKGISILGENADTSILENCVVEYVYNEESYGQSQAAINVNSRHAIINKCIIKKNTGYYGGGIYCAKEAYALIQNSIITDNSSDYYGGIFIHYANALIVNNLIADNGMNMIVLGANENSDTVRIFNNTLVQNNVYNGIWGNSIVSIIYGFVNIQNLIISGKSDINSYEPEIIRVYNSGYASFENCIIEGGKTNIRIDNSNVILNDFYDANPHFVDQLNQNYQLSDSSFGINSGKVLLSDILSLMPNDLAGNPRVFDDAVDKIDIGAYEFQGSIIANRPPSINNPGARHIFISSSKEMKFSFSDIDESDTHTLSVTTDNPNISLGALSSQSNDATYTVNPSTGWGGTAHIILSVTDNHGAQDLDTFSVVVSDTVNYDITENTTWDKDTIYIGSSFIVFKNATLEILAGTCVLFKDNYNITTYGTVHALGTPSDNILFTSNDTSGFSDRTHKGWGGITVSSDQNKSVFNNCIFEYTKDNGVIEMSENSSADFVNCTFRFNGARLTYMGNEAIINGEDAYVYIGNCLFYDNQSRYGTIYLYRSDIAVCNSNFYYNSGTFATLVNHYGGKTSIKNSIFWNNWSRDWEIEATSQDNYEISNCIVEGGENALYTNNLVNTIASIYNVYPQFVDSFHRDFRLLSGSSCINSGVNDALLAKLNSIDLDGNSRIFNGSVLLPDIGAYEYQGEPSNRPPVLEKVEDKTAMLGKPLTGKVNFFDADESDTHTITVQSNNVNVTVQNLSGDTTGSVYTLVPSAGFEGDVDISVIVEDNGGLRDSIFYDLQVSSSACGNIYEDMVWDADTIQVVCDVIVEKGATLIIEPWVKVIFNGPYMLDVYGTLKAKGTVSDTIRFILSDTITFNETVYANAWRGIKLNSAEGQDTSELRYCEIRNSKEQGLELGTYSKAIISSCNIHHNVNKNNGSGVGIYSHGKYSVIENCYIHHNQSNQKGGGIYSSGYDNKIINNIISDNSSRLEGGGIYSYKYTAPGSIIESNTIQNNHSTDAGGGGIFTQGYDTIRNNIIRNNYSQYGGGIKGYQKCHIINNRIEGNICSNTQYGGGLYLYAGSFDVINNVIINNYAGAGGSGIYLSSTNGLVANNTICKNTSNSDGNGIYLNGDKSPALVNNILWGNGSSVSKSQIYLGNELSPEIRYCIIEGGKDNITYPANLYYANEYSDNIDIYPYFADTANNNFSLTDSSICINSGSPDTTGMNLPQTDIAGNPRIYNGAVDRIDIGAYEYIGEPVNRRPVLYEMGNITLFSSQTRQMKVEYLDTDDGDTHTLTVESNEPNLTIENLSGDTTCSTYDVVAAAGWQGPAIVKVKVEDNQGLKDSVYYSVNVSDSVCGEITDNLIWDKDTVFVTCDITIPAGKTLTILPGTIVVFTDISEISVNGTLIAEGTEQKRIVFIPEDTSISNPKNHWKGIYFHSYSSSADTSKLTYCDIQRGNVKIVRDKVIVSNCLFNKCSFSNGGGICVFNSSPLIENSIFSNNSVSNTGGGISCIDDDYFDGYKTNPVIRGNEFFNNKATHGGAIYAGETGAIISNNIIHHNRASYGGAVYFYEYGNNPILQNNLMYENTATSIGGAVCYDESSRSYQMNNTIVKNKSGKGGGLYIQSYSYPQIYNDIIYFNEAGQSGQQVYLNGYGSTPYFYNCFIQYGFDSITGGGAGTEYAGQYKNNLSAEPLFVDTANHNYQLSDSSFCINAGTMNITGLVIPERDIAGNTRVFAGTLANIDVGAYEFQGNPKNRKPIIEHTKDQYTFISERKKLSVNFTDVDKTDTHIITIASGNINVTVENISGNISGSTYELVPANEWQGASEIYVKVEDDKGNYATDTFNLIVSEYYCGSITENTIWDADTVKIACDVTIEKGATLTILPGTVVIFDEYACLKVLGRLLAVGTIENRITFTSSDITGYPGETYKGWRGIRFYGPNNSETSQLEYCTIQYAKGINNGFVNDTYGGGLYIDDWSGILIANCQISDNSAVERGGGLYCNNSGARIINNIISNNNTGWSGGGLYTSGSYPYTYLTNNVICNNLSDIYGGGIYGSNIYSFNNLIVNNRANYGGGLYIENGRFYNTIIWGNTAANSYPQLSAGNSSVYLYNSVLEGGLTNVGYSATAVKTYENMIEQNPQFVLPSQGAGTDFNGLTANWSLRASSPCINKGITEIDIYGYECPVTDIEGESRILMDSIDIGAFEFRNYAPEKISAIIDRQTNVAVPANISIPVTGVFTDSNIDDLLTYEVSGINTPHWMGLGMVGGIINITGTPEMDDIGVTKISVTATDRFYEIATDTFEIAVLANNPPVVQNKLPDAMLHILENLSYSIPENSFTDPDVNDVLSYSAKLENGSNLPGWITSDTINGVFTGIPQAQDTGVISIIVTATDLANNFVTDTFTISVLDATFINGIVDKQYKIYPVPADEIINIELINTKIFNGSVELIDINGKTIELQPLLKNSLIQINVSAIPAGLYCLRIKYGTVYCMYTISIL